jgi:hypothetical protein
MLLTLFHDDCEGNDNVKRPTTPDSVCMTKQAFAGGREVADESEDYGTYTATQPRGNMLTLYPRGIRVKSSFSIYRQFHSVLET